jgi:hypothetical protein
MMNEIAIPFAKVRPVLLQMALASVLISCSRDGPKQTSAEAKQQANAKVREEFARSFNGVDISDSAMFTFSMDRTYSLEVERLLTSSGKIIVFEAELSDIRRGDDDTLAVFVPHLWSTGVDVYWSLKVPTGLLDSLLSIPRQRHLSAVLVAARVVSVHRPLLTLTAEAFEDAAPTIKPEAAEYSVVRGELLGFRPLR